MAHDYPTVLRASNRHNRQLVARRDVFAVGVGDKRVGGESTGEPSVKVFVPRKIALSELPAHRVLPKELETARGEKALVDVEEMDKPVSPPAFTALAGLELGPALIPEWGAAVPLPGASVGHIGLGIGSIAACGQEEDAPDHHYPYFLSCNHVFAEFNRAGIRDPIMQPATLDGGLYPRDRVGRLVRYVSLSFGGGSANFVDAALAEAVNPEGGNNYVNAIGPIRGLAPKGTIRAGNRVRKVGRSSGLTQGRIVAVHTTVKVDYWGVGPVGRDTLFHDQIVTTLMGVFGDSGSLLLDNRNRAVGLLFGGSATHTYFNYIHTVSELLRIKI